MREYDGAVAFLDLLGIGRLTRGAIEVRPEDFAAFATPAPSGALPHRFAAHLLTEFRQALLRARARSAEVQFAQLSDSAFLWSRNPLHLTNAARAVMWEITLRGILCRGGLAFGRIVEPEKVNRSLGAFVLGEAATRAVDIERAGKGCRLFSDVDLPSRLIGNMESWQATGWGEGVWNAPFDKISNPLDGAVVDEFRWYFYPDPILMPFDTERIAKRSLIGVMKIVSLLQYSPRFRWNCSSMEGLQQLGVSVESVSRCTSQFGEAIDCFYPAHLFKEHPPIRTAEGAERITQNRISAVENYFKWARKARVAVAVNSQSTEE